MSRKDFTATLGLETMCFHAKLAATFSVLICAVDEPLATNYCLILVDAILRGEGDFCNYNQERIIHTVFQGVIDRVLINP